MLVVYLLCGVSLLVDYMFYKFGNHPEQVRSCRNFNK